MDTKAKRLHLAHGWMAAMITLTLAIVPTPAAGTIYKCQGDNGAPIYQDEPCRAGKELRDFDKDPPTVSVMPLGPAAMKSGGSGRKIARWTYLPVPEDAQTITTLTFEHGRLVEVERKVVK